MRQKIPLTPPLTPASVPQVQHFPRCVSPRCVLISGIKRKVPRGQSAEEECRPGACVCMSSVCSVRRAWGGPDLPTWATLVLWGRGRLREFTRKNLTVGCTWRRRRRKRRRKKLHYEKEKMWTIEGCWEKKKEEEEEVAL